MITSPTHMQLLLSAFVPARPLNLIVPAIGTLTPVVPSCRVTSSRPQPGERVTRASVSASRRSPTCRSSASLDAVTRPMKSSTHSAFFPSALRAPFPNFVPVVWLRPLESLISLSGSVERYLYVFVWISALRIPGGLGGLSSFRLAELRSKGLQKESQKWISGTLLLEHPPTYEGWAPRWLRVGTTCLAHHDTVGGYYRRCLVAWGKVGNRVRQVFVL